MRSERSRLFSRPQDFEGMDEDEILDYYSNLESALGKVESALEYLKEGDSIDSKPSRIAEELIDTIEREMNSIEKYANSEGISL